MPQTYAFIEACRAAFGVKEVNAQIRLGIEGACSFHAVENGIEVGTRPPDPVRYVTGATMVFSRSDLPMMEITQRLKKERL